MKDKRVLIISSEVVPYLPQTEQAVNSFQIPKAINDHGGQTRIFMPRYGLINERRHQLHEVIRLSGMNLVINDIAMSVTLEKGDSLDIPVGSWHHPQNRTDEPCLILEIQHGEECIEEDIERKV